MLIKTRGIVFRAFKYSESSLILDIYTEQRGLRKYIVSGVRGGGKGRSQAGLYQVMSLLELVAYERDDRELNRIKEARPAYVFQGIPFDVRKGAVGLFMAEVARKTIREREENPALFEFLYEQFSYLDQTTATVANLHLHFLLHLSGYLGFAPDTEDFGPQACFDWQEGQFVGEPPSHPYYLDGIYSPGLYALLQLPAARCHEAKLSRAERRALLDGLLVFFRLHVEGMADIKAHEVLREVLD